MEKPTPIVEPIELTVVIPTLNEHDNIRPLIDKLEQTLAGVNWEIVFVDDDSQDGTVELIRGIAARDRRIRLLHRIGRRGLSSACIEGMLSSSAIYMAVMDADMQHDESLLPQMLEQMRKDQADVVIGSRYTDGGGVGDWAQSRHRMSRFASRLSRLVLKAEVTDPMSGFFMLRSEVFREAMRDLSGIGFKILLDILSSSRQLRVKELPYKFRNRLAGDSKLDTMAVWEYLTMLMDKLFGHIVPVRFVLFTAVGLLGLGVHLLVLGVAHRSFGLNFELAQLLATLVAMSNNYVLNNVFTYRDRRLRGWRFVRGLVSFYLICSFGAFANVGVASYLYGAQQQWWAAGVSGALIGAVWNYAVSSVFTWRTPKRA